MHTFYVHPADFGLPKAAPADLKGGDAVENAAIITAVLNGTRGAARDVVLLNAGAGLFVAGRSDSVAAGIRRAADAIDNGSARATLDRMVRSSHTSRESALHDAFDSAQGGPSDSTQAPPFGSTQGGKVVA